MFSRDRYRAAAIKQAKREGTRWSPEFRKALREYDAWIRKGNKPPELQPNVGERVMKWFLFTPPVIVLSIALLPGFLAAPILFIGGALWFFITPFALAYVVVYLFAGMTGGRIR